MHKRLGLAFVFSLATVLTVLGSRPASAQGSLPVPTGGGWMKPVTKVEGGGATETKLGWSWGRTGWGSFLPLTRTTVPRQELNTGVQRTHGWVVKVVR